MIETTRGAPEMWTGEVPGTLVDRATHRRRGSDHRREALPPTIGNPDGFTHAYGGVSLVREAHDARSRPVDADRTGSQLLTNGLRALRRSASADRCPRDALSTPRAFQARRSRLEHADPVQHPRQQNPAGSFQLVPGQDDVVPPVVSASATNSTPSTMRASTSESGTPRTGGLSRRTKSASRPHASNSSRMRSLCSRLTGSIWSRLSAGRNEPEVRDGGVRARSSHAGTPVGEPLAQPGQVVHGEDALQARPAEIGGHDDDPSSNLCQRGAEVRDHDRLALAAVRARDQDRLVRGGGATPSTPVRSLLNASAVMRALTSRHDEGPCPPLRRLVLGMAPPPGSRASPRARPAMRTASLLRSLISAAANPRPRPSSDPDRDVELMSRRRRRGGTLAGSTTSPGSVVMLRQRHELVLEEQLAAAQHVALGLQAESCRGVARQRPEPIARPPAASSARLGSLSVDRVASVAGSRPVPASDGIGGRPRRMPRPPAGPSRVSIGERDRAGTACRSPCWPRPA